MMNGEIEEPGNEEPSKVTRYRLPWNGREIEAVNHGITAEEVDATVAFLRADRF